MPTEIYQGIGLSDSEQVAFAQGGSSGDNALVSSVANQRIIVLSAVVITNAPVNLKFRSNTTDISALWYLAQNGGFVLPFSKRGWFTTAIGEALQFNLSGSVAVGVHVVYSTSR